MQIGSSEAYLDLTLRRRTQDSIDPIYSISARRLYTSTHNEQEAQLSQKDRATRYVSCNLVNCCTAVRKVTFLRLAVNKPRR